MCSPKLDVAASVARLKLTARGQGELQAARNTLAGQLRAQACGMAKACLTGASATAAGEAGVLGMQVGLHAGSPGTPGCCCWQRPRR